MHEHSGNGDAAANMNPRGQEYEQLANLLPFTALTGFSLICVVLMVILTFSVFACCRTQRVTIDNKILLSISSILSVAMTSIAFYFWMCMSAAAYVYTELALSIVYILVLVAFGVYWLTQKEEESTTSRSTWIFTSFLLALEVAVMITFAMRFRTARSLALSN